MQVNCLCTLDMLYGTTSNSCLPGELGLDSSPSVLFSRGTFEDTWHRIFKTRMSFLSHKHPCESTKRERKERKSIYIAPFIYA